jgi:glycosyltransferase involved in cell wall biosynthesis
MRILIVHQHYLMPGQPGGSRFNEMARFWAEQGHEVTVIAGTVDYGSGRSPDRYRRRWIVKENDGAVLVYRCYVPATYASSYPGRMWAFLGFTLSASTAALRAARPDVVIATSPPLIATIPGWVAARLAFHRIPWIFEIRDLWPESAITTGVLRSGSFVANLLEGLERFACRSSTKINVLTPAFEQNLLARGLAAPAKIVFIPNGADLDWFRPASKQNWVREKFGWNGHFVVMYSGAHGRANAIGQLVETAELLRDVREIRLACVGDGPERARLEMDAFRRGLTNIQFCGPQSKETMPDFIAACDVGAAVLQDNPTFRTVYPNKIFDYMSSSRPTLLAIDGVARRLVCDDAQAGVFAAPENPQALAASVRWLYEHREECAAMGERGRRWVEANAGRRELAMRYLDILKGLVGETAGA